MRLSVTLIELLFQRPTDGHGLVPIQGNNIHKNDNN